MSPPPKRRRLLPAGPAFLLALGGLFFNSAVPAFPLGRRDKPPPPVDGPAAAQPDASVPSVDGPGGPIRRGDLVELEGRIRLVGSEPFPDLVLTGGDDADWYLEGSSRRALQPYEQRTVRVRGRVDLREIILANGRSLGFRRYLLDVELAEKQAPPDQQAD